MPNCPGERSCTENSKEHPSGGRGFPVRNVESGSGYAAREEQDTVDAGDRETDEVLAVENFKEAQHRKKPSDFNEKVHQIFIVQRAVEERTWENVVDEPVCDFIRTDYETEKPHGERDKADEAEEREVIVFLWFVHDIKSLCWEVSGVRKDKLNPKAANLIAEALDADERTERFLRQMIPSIGLQEKVADEDYEAPQEP